MPTAWQITDVSNSARQKVNILKTQWQTYGCQELYLQIFTHNLGVLVLLGLFIDTHCRLWDSWFFSTVQLDVSLWP